MIYLNFCFSLREMTQDTRQLRRIRADPVREFPISGAGHTRPGRGANCHSPEPVCLPCRPTGATTRPCVLPPALRGLPAKI